MTSRRRKNVGAFAVAGVMTLVLGACAGDDAGASRGATKLANRTQTPAATGGAGTGPTETGPTETGPTVAPDSGWVDGGSPGGAPPEYDLPPEEAVPSTPKEGELVARYHEWVGTSPHFVFVYADGRVISWTKPEPYLSATLSERRLTPEGVELVRSGAVQPEDFIRPTSEVPADAWEDPEIKPFVPSKYAVCFWMEGGSTRSGFEDPSRVVGFFPAPARAILRGGNDHTNPNDPPCTEVTTDEARGLMDILGTLSSSMYGTPVRVEDSEGDEVFWEIPMILPHGAIVPCTDCY